MTDDLVLGSGVQSRPSGAAGLAGPLQAAPQRTYQVPIAHIEDLAGPDFGALEEADPLRDVEGIAPREVLSAADMVVT
jgi:hypothetical protein